MKEQNKAKKGTEKFVCGIKEQQPKKAAQEQQKPRNQEPRTFTVKGWTDKANII